MSKKKLALLNILIIFLAVFYINGCKKDPVEPAPQPENGTTEVQPPVETSEKAPEPLKVINSAESDNQPKVEKGPWIQNYELAKKLASEQNKDILIDFTGSDWCRWCIVLDKEVFSKEEFLNKATEDFVLLKLDFPRDESLITPEIKTQNDRLNAKYGVEGFPTILLTDKDGVPYGRTGYRQGGVEAYLAHLEELRNSGFEFKQLVSKVESAELDDIQKAKILDQAIKKVSPDLIKKFYSEYIDRIIALDSNNQSGLQHVYKVTKIMWLAEEDMDNGNVSAALTKIDSAIKQFDLQGPLAQEIYYFKAQIHNFNGDKQASLDSLKLSLQAAPDTEFGESIRRTIVNHFPDEKLDQE